MVQETWDFAVIGGGAAGMAAAIAASELGDRVVLIEKSSFLGKKITASGNGRCNLMNLREPVYYGDREFALEALRSFGKEDLKHFWSSLGLCLSEEEGRIYPSTFQSASVIDVLKTRLKTNGVTVFLQTPVNRISRENGAFRLSCGEKDFRAKRVLVAAGGPASPKLGGTDAGYGLLQAFGHMIIPASPALCPLVTDKRSVSGLSGIRCRCGIALYSVDGTLLHKEKGEVLFTDSGISGICAMQCARFVRGDGCRVELDLVNRVFPDDQMLISALKNRREKAGIFPIETVCTGFLMPKLAFAVMKQAEIETRGRTAGDLRDEELTTIAERLHRYTLQVTGTKGLEEAQVTAGGADCREFDPLTMESRLQDGLYAAGEILNVDGDCGGYNLMFAFASGIQAGRNGRKDEQA